MQLKQKTVRNGRKSQTVVLKRLQNDFDRGGKWMYTIEDLDTGEYLEDPFTNKREAERTFRGVVDDIERGMASAKSKDMGLGSTDKLLEPFDNDDLL